MKLYSWNVNGIRAAIRSGHFATFVATHQPDVLCLQETKAQQGQAEIDLPDYEEYWNSAARKGHFGTAIFTKIKPRQISYGLPEDIIAKFGVKGDTFGDINDEGRVTTAEFDNCHVVTVYTPNSKPDLARLEQRHKHWDPAFLAYCKKLEATKPVIFCGDLNVAHTEIDLANPKPNRGKRGFTDEEREGFQNMVDAGFVDTFRIFTKEGGHYSWWTHWANARARNVGWRIDYFMVSDSIKDKVTKAAIHADVLGSDHCPISLQIDL